MRLCVRNPGNCAIHTWNTTASKAYRPYYGNDNDALNPLSSLYKFRITAPKRYNCEGRRLGAKCASYNALPLGRRRWDALLGQNVFLVLGNCSGPREPPDLQLRRPGVC